MYRVPFMDQFMTAESVNTTHIAPHKREDSRLAEAIHIVREEEAILAEDTLRGPHAERPLICEHEEGPEPCEEIEYCVHVEGEEEPLVL